jgi:uncharacterized membrane protein YeiB
LTAETRRPSETRRLPGLDLARALAIVAMVLVNYDVVLSSGEGTAWLETATALFQGRASALFVVLAGAGLTLLARSAPGRASTRILRRALALLVLGYGFVVLWEGDILHFYGFYFLLGWWGLRLSDRALLALAAALVLAFPLLILLGLDYEAGWNWDTLHYAGFWTVAGQARNLLFNGFHPLLPWGAFLLFGQWLGRRLTDEPPFTARLASAALAVAVAAEVLSALAVVALPAGDEGRFLFDTASMPPMPLYVLAAGGEACLVIALALSVARRFPRARPLAPLLHTGQLSLTFYVGHVLLGILPPWLLLNGGGEGTLGRGTVVGWWVISCVLGVFLAHRWRLSHVRGPLEAVLRRTTG